MSYEDFIEGIKPSLGKDQEKLSYQIEPGIFKQIATDAAFAYVSREDDQASQVLEFSDLYFGRIVSVIRQ
ncbi:MAG TPA: hypothetical protein VGC22_02505 [Chitinophaga sp.]